MNYDHYQLSTPILSYPPTVEPEETTQADTAFFQEVLTHLSAFLSRQDQPPQHRELTQLKAIHYISLQSSGDIVTADLVENCCNYSLEVFYEQLAQHHCYGHRKSAEVRKRGYGWEYVLTILPSFANEKHLMVQSPTRNERRILKKLEELGIISTNDRKMGRSGYKMYSLSASTLAFLMLMTNLRRVFPDCGDSKSIGFRSMSVDAFLNHCTKIANYGVLQQASPETHTTIH